MPGRSLPVNLCWLKLTWKLPHNKGSQVQTFRTQTKHQQQQNSDLRAESGYSLLYLLKCCLLQLLVEWQNSGALWGSPYLVLEAPGVRSPVLKGNFHQVVTPHTKLTLLIINFVPVFIYHGAREQCEHIMPCGIEKQEVRRKEAQGTHTIKYFPI